MAAGGGRWGWGGVRARTRDALKSNARRVVLLGDVALAPVVNAPGQEPPRLSRDLVVSSEARPEDRSGCRCCRCCSPDACKTLDLSLTPPPAAAITPPSLRPPNDDKGDRARPLRGGGGADHGDVHGARHLCAAADQTPGGGAGACACGWGVGGVGRAGRGVQGFKRELKCSYAQTQQGEHTSTQPACFNHLRYIPQFPASPTQTPEPPTPHAHTSNAQVRRQLRTVLIALQETLEGRPASAAAAAAAATARSNMQSFVVDHSSDSMTSSVYTTASDAADGAAGEEGGEGWEGEEVAGAAADGLAAACAAKVVGVVECAPGAVAAGAAVAAADGQQEEGHEEEEEEEEAEEVEEEDLAADAVHPNEADTIRRLNEVLQLGEAREVKAPGSVQPMQQQQMAMQQQRLSCDILAVAH